MIVADFDKTLTNYDTGTVFFVFSAKKKGFGILSWAFVYSFKVLSKLKFISVKTEKESMANLFLPKSENGLEEIARVFAKTIELNALGDDIAKKTDVIIASAGFDCYLKHVYPSHRIIGTQLVLTKKKKFRIKEHPYGKEKAELLQEKLNVDRIDEFYTDSISDMPTSLMAHKTYWIKDGKTINVT
ncbi:MAG: hypothetical protein Roseis2KO_22300 [Roseivirga sp.]